MDWKERVEHYREGGSSAPMKTEDLAARSIVSGLCGSGGKTHLLAGRLGVFSEEYTEFGLARRILDAVSGGMFHPMSPSRRFVLDVRQENRSGTCWSGDELEDLCDIASSANEGMIVVCRRETKLGPKCESFVFLTDAIAPPQYVLRPVSCLVERKHGVCVWKRETKRLFADMRDCFKWEIPEV